MIFKIRENSLKVVCFDSFEKIPKDFLKETVNLYRTAFGEKNNDSGSVWGEGAYCSAEGKSRKISIDEYNTLLKKGVAVCDCGSEYVPYHEKSTITESIKDNFYGNSVIRGRICFLTDHHDRVKGFSWGSIRDTTEVIEKLGQSYASPLTKKEFQKIVNTIDSKLSLFFEEIAIDKSCRGISDNVLSLTAPILEISLENSVRPIIFRTLEGSRIYSFSQKIGFRTIFRKEGKPIIYHPNIIRTFRLLKIFGPRTMKAALKRISPVQ